MLHLQRSGHISGRFQGQCKTLISQTWRRLNSRLSAGNHWLQTSEEVQAALDTGQPLVALESTIITHGMPYPHNLQTAQSVENIIRLEGAVPATVGVIKGKVHVGLTQQELEELAAPDNRLVKTSRRDLPYVLSQGLSGGTTVSGTMIAAHTADIPIFVTGGIGGVHRGAQDTMDISADLTELGRTPVAVVSAGVKSILDIGRTLEYLETQGVCVATFSPGKNFPAFFVPDSGFKSPYNVQGPKEAAALIYSSLSASLGSGMLIAVPIPSEAAAAGEDIETAIQAALAEAEKKGIFGKEVTPFILDYVNKLTEGQSLQANIALIENNARVGGRIAVELQKLKKESQGGNPSNPGHHSHGRHRKNEASGKDTTGRVAVVGGVNVDFTITPGNNDVQNDGSTFPGTIKQSFGGVGRNIADCLSRLDVNPMFLCAVGHDIYADLFKQQSRHMDLSCMAVLSSHSTATCSIHLDSAGNLQYCIGDFSIHQEITPKYIEETLGPEPDIAIMCMDGNISAEAMEYICQNCHKRAIPVWFEPTSIHQVQKLFKTSAHKHLTYCSPNLIELRGLYEHYTGRPAKASHDESSCTQTALVDEVLLLSEELVRLIPNLLVTLGCHGVMLCRNTDVSEPLPIKHRSHEHPKSRLSAVHLEILPTEHIVSVSGAGDCLASAVIAGMLQGLPVEQCLRAGLAAARQSLQQSEAVPASMTKALLWEAASPECPSLKATYF